MRLGKEEQRREVMMRRRNLRGRKERIAKDLTWGERKTKWKLEKIAREEKKRGNRERLGYGRIMIEEER